jgi:hypothetical protein
MPTPSLTPQDSIPSRSYRDRGAVERDKAIARAEIGAPAFWLDCVDSAIHILEPGTLFTSDDVWDRLSLWGIKPPDEPRAMGAGFRIAQGRGKIEPTEDFRPARRIQAHKSPCRVWRRTTVGSSVSPRIPTPREKGPADDVSARERSAVQPGATTTSKDPATVPLLQHRHHRREEPVAECALCDKWWKEKYGEAF